MIALNASARSPTRMYLLRPALNRRTIITLGALIAACLHSAAVMAAEPAAAAKSRPAGNASKRVMLWNGRDLSGWTLYFSEAGVEPKSVWRATDGVLRFDTKTKGYIRTERMVSNYHLHVEWRWPKDAVPNTNSGVLVHVHGEDFIWPKSFEAQLKNGNAGQVVGMGLDIPDAPVLVERKRAPRLAEPSEKPLGEWNSADVYCRPNTIEYFVNGVKQNYVDKLPVSAGAIALQMEGFTVEFRNLWMEGQ